MVRDLENRDRHVIIERPMNSGLHHSTADFYFQITKITCQFIRVYSTPLHTVIHTPTQIPSTTHTIQKVTIETCNKCLDSFINILRRDQFSPSCCFWSILDTGDCHQLWAEKLLLAPWERQDKRHKRKEMLCLSKGFFYFQYHGNADNI